MLNVQKSTKDSKFTYKGLVIIGYNLGSKHYYIKNYNHSYFDKLKNAKTHIDKFNLKSYQCCNCLCEVVMKESDVIDGSAIVCKRCNSL